MHISQERDLMVKRTYYYVSGNTANGFVNYLPSNIKNIERVVVLQHPSHTVKTNIIKRLIHHMDNGLCNEIEIICSAYSKDYLDGVICREKSIAVITDNIAIPNYPNTIKMKIENDIGS